MAPLFQHCEASFIPRTRSTAAKFSPDPSEIQVWSEDVGLAILARISSRNDGSVMLRRIFLSLLLAAAAAFAVYWWLTAPPPRLAVTTAAYSPKVGNGEIIFNAGGCSSCHAVPGQPDRFRLGGGLAIPSPFGTFYAPNISPDPTDGIGRWSETDFVEAVMKGVSPGGTHYFPAFPYPSYSHATVKDVRDLFAYLKTLAPVTGKV